MAAAHLHDVDLDAAKPSPQRRDLRTMLSDASVSKKHLSYVETTLHPCLASMVADAVREMPTEPALFCLQWCLTRLRVPATLADPVRHWLHAQTSTLNAGTAETRTTPKHAQTVETTCSDPVASTSTHDAASVVKGVVVKGTTRDSSAASMVSKSLTHESVQVSRVRRKSILKNSLPTVTVAPNPEEDDAQALVQASGRREAWQRRRTVSTIPVLAFSEVVELLRRVPIIGGNLDEAEIKSAAEFVSVQKVEACGNIVQHGSDVDELTIIHSGECQVYVPHLVNTLTSGGTFGEASLTRGTMPSAHIVSVSADGPAVILRVASTVLDSVGLKSRIRKKNMRSSSRCIRNQERDAKCRHEKRRVSATRSRLMSDWQGTRPPLVEKSQRDMEMIRTAVQSNVQLAELLQLTQEQVEEMARSMVLWEVEPGVPIITKGDKGDAFYVVNDGVIDVVIDPDPSDPRKNRNGQVPVKLRAGDSFGELALLYDSPRKATVIPVRKSSLWVLELPQWRSVLKMRPQSRADAYVSVLAAVPEFQQSDAFELRLVAEGLDEIYFMSGEDVVAEGDAGNTMFLVLEGSCELSRRSSNERTTISKGGFFGEGSLFRGELYSASVKVLTETATLLVLDRVALDFIHAKSKTMREHMGFEHSSSASGAQRRRSLWGAAHGASLGNGGRQAAADGSKLSLDQLDRVGILGCGSFALVTLEHDKATNKFYALKKMSKKTIVQMDLQSMVVGEKQALGDIESDFVISLVQTFQDDRCVYILLEASTGGELFELYNSNDWFGSEPHCVFYTACISLGLDDMHQKKIVHRDIKLENILLDTNGYVKISDMGLAKVVVGKTYTVCGTSDYLAPETLKQTGHNRAVDWWAVGVLIFVMMSGRSPFDAEDVMQIYRNIVKGFRKEHFPNTFDSDLIDIIKALCRKKPEERITMIAGGVKNLKRHPWLLRLPWDKVEARTFEAPFIPPEMTVEGFQKVLKQDTDDVLFDAYEDDGTGWEESF